MKPCVQVAVMKDKWKAHMAINKPWNFTWKSALGMIGIGAISALVINWIYFLLPAVQNNEAYAQVANRQFALPLVKALLLYGCYYPALEELLFRKVFFSIVRRYLGVWMGIFSSALLFGFYHGNWVQGTYATIMGIALAYVYQKYQTIWAPILFHAAANVAVYLMMYL